MVEPVIPALNELVTTDPWWPDAIQCLTLSITIIFIYSKQDLHAVYIRLITYLNLFLHSKLVLHSSS